MFTKSKNGLSGVLAVVVLAGLSIGLSVAIGAEDVAPPAVNYPHAGVSIAMPKGFVTHVVPDSSVVMRAGMTVGRQTTQAVTLSAVCVGPKATASEFADHSAKVFKSQLSVRKFQALKSVPIKVAGLTGVARLLKYSFDGVPTVAARVFFLRELKGQGVRLCYSLIVEVDAKYERKLLPTLDQVIKGVKLITLKSPASITTRLSPRKLSDYRGGFSVRLPEGWYGQSVPNGVSLGQKNYLIGGVDSPQVSILSAKTKPDASAKAFAKMAVSRYLGATTQPDSGVELVSQGPVKIGDQDAYQYVLKLTYEVAPATQPVAATSPAKPVKIAKIQAVRVVCRPDSDGKSVKAYLFTLLCMDSDAKLVTPWFDKLGEGFEYLPLSGAPADPK